jgi:ElaB/YqjD/DUF883 family membrane-anchored ribosome-binding protein
VNANASQTAKEAEKAEASAKALADEVKELRRELKALAEQVGKVGRTGVDELTTKARTKAAEGVEAGHALAAEVRSEIDDLNAQVVAATRENPWRSLGYAALAGVVFGLLIRR